MSHEGRRAQGHAPALAPRAAAVIRLRDGLSRGFLPIRRRDRIDCSTVSVFTVRILAGIARSQPGGPRTDRPRTLGLARDSLHHGGEIGEVVFEEFHQLGAPSLWPTCLPSLTASECAADQGQTAK